MKTTIKEVPLTKSDRIRMEKFQAKASEIFKNVVVQQVENANAKDVKLSSAQKAHLNCNSHI